MASYPRPLRAIVPLLAALLLVAAPVGAAPRPAASAAELAPAAATDRLIITLSPAASLGLQSAADPAAVAVQLSDDAGAELAYVRALGDDAHVLALAAPRPYAEVAAIARRLAAAPEVLSAEPDLVVFPTREPTDSGYSNFAWHLKPVDGGSYGANLPAAWDITTGDAAIVTAIIDTGARLDHEDLAGRTLPGNPGYDMIGELVKANDGDGRDPDPSDPGDYVTEAELGLGCGSHYSSWHGTHVAGTIGARANNGKGMAGIVWDAPLLHIRALGKCGGYLSDIADGIRWAVGLSVGGLPVNPNPARVINLSLGGTGTCAAYFQNAVDAALSRGTLVVVAAGNENRSAATYTPGNCADVITVAATSQYGARAPYSNFGSAVEIAAPGGHSAVDSMVYSTLNTGLYGPEGDSYAYYQGTSMATPHVAGVIALMLSANPTLGPADVLSILQSTATPFPLGSGCEGLCGAGIVNGGAAVEEAARRVRTASFQSDSTSIAEGAVAVSLPIGLSIPSNQSVVVPFTVAGSAGAGDHNLGAGSLTFAPGATTASLSVAITDDALIEGVETIVISLGSGDRSGLGAITAHTIRVNDNDLRPAVAVAPATLSFGEQRVGTLSATQMLTVSNAGDLPLTVGGLSLSAGYSRSGGACPAAFPFTLAKGASCTVGVQFAPTRTGARNGSLTVSSDAGAPRSGALSGVGVIPALGFGPTSLSFADQLVGAASPTSTLMLTNPGSAPLQISAIAASGDYRVGAAGCVAALPATLAPGGSCAVEVGFTPQAGGQRAGALTVTSDAPGGPYRASLRGGGLAPALGLDAAALNFGGQRVGASAGARAVTVANPGGAPLTLTGLSLSGAAFARVGGSCPTTFPSALGAGASCTVLLSFTPALNQAYAGALSVQSAGLGGSATVALAGVGTAGPAASPQLSPAALVFDARVLPAASGARAVTVSNRGEASMAISGLAVAGAGFSLSGGSCGAPPLALGPGASCSVEVSMGAAATGAYSGTLTVISDAPGGPQVATLAGSVVAGPGAYDLEEVTLAATPYTVTLRFTVTRATPAEGPASVGYSVTADRELANGDLVVAAGSAAFAAGETGRELVLTLDRLALYGATYLVLDLDEPLSRAGVSPAASRRVALPAEDYRLYVPLAWR